ncbi:MAG TPA: glycosyltransferase family 4 protein [Burkholderiales bacterium]|nr:glycosyltransferase family 4 protein [Burkholderiales bacterium]
MQIAFYAPLRSPDITGNADDRDRARFLMAALMRAGHAVELASSFSSLDENGDPIRQRAKHDEGVALAESLAARWRTGRRANRPEAWLTHHVYYKAPDWLGPLVSAQLGIPYIIAEASHAPRRAGGPWAIGHEAAAEAIRRAELILCETRRDMAGVEPLVFHRERVVRFPQFIDPAPFRAAAASRDAYRDSIAATFGLDPKLPWIVAESPMQPGDRLASYRALIAALETLVDLPWRLILAGEGPVRSEIETACDASLPGRVRFLRTLETAERPPVYAASDLCIWPSINETYGRQMYQAQAAGIPVVSCAPRGMPDSVEEGRTGVRVPPNDADGFARAIRGLLLDPERRAEMGAAAAAFIVEERSLDAAAIRLNKALAKIVR